MGGQNSIYCQEIINMKITAYNQYKVLREYDLEEFTISGNPSDEAEVCVTALRSEDVANIYTSDNVYLTKFKKLIEANPDAWKITQVVERSDGTISGVMLQALKKCLSFRAGKEAERSLSEDQKAELRERLAAARIKKQS
jgi:hypothetical protein